MDRRTFLGALSAGAATSLLSFDSASAAPWVRRFASTAERARLPIPPTVSAQDLTLRAAPSSVDFGQGARDAWTLNGEMPAPTLRLRRGDAARILLQNELPEPTILHWHGLDVPEAADGHPRLAIGTGESYQYDFTVQDRAGLYWYHPHPHGRTAAQTYQGMAGLIVIEDDEEAALDLPGEGFDIPLVLQDKRLDEGASLEYTPARMGPDRMYGYLGNTAFANGVPTPTVEVTPGRHRLRILNASNARILDLGLTEDAGMTLLGTDGGLLERAAPIERMLMGTGERADVLVDFSAFRPGDRVMLRSFPFGIPGAMGMAAGTAGRGGGGGMGGMHANWGGLGQGVELDFVEFVVVDGPTWDGAPLPDRLSELAPAPRSGGTPAQTFRFDSAMMRHTINGQSFEMERVDARIQRGVDEVWSLVNEGPLPHPIHIHAGQFRILSRTGGRGALQPWETGRKDTVVSYPGERIDVGVRFDRHDGLFLLHCHNLEHEDMGMMSNFRVET